MSRKVTAYLALIAMLFGGCKGPERLIAEWPPGEGDEAKYLRAEGTYALYKRKAPAEVASPSADDESQAGEPSDLRGMCRLSSPGPVGFEKGENGQLFAVVGEERIPLPPGSYCWCPVAGKPEAGDLSRGQKVVLALHRTGEAAGNALLVVCIVVVCAGIIVAYLMAAGHTA